MIEKNQIVLKGIIHEFIEDKPRVDNCYKCSLKEICYEKFENFVCGIFFDEKITNGHFEIKAK